MAVPTVTALPAIPDPVATLTRAQLDELAPTFLAWIVTVDDVETAEEARLRLAALEEYLSRRGDDAGPVQTMARTNEAHIGGLLGKPDGHAGRPRSDEIARRRAISSQRHGEFWLLHDHWPKLVGKLPATRERLLGMVRRLAEHEAEHEARAIAIGGDEADSGDGWTMLGGDFRERLEPYTGLVDLIVTDPPYAAEFAPVWSDLAEQAARLLRPQGILVALTGKIMLPDVLDRLGEHLAYGWCYCQPLPGSSSRILARHVGQSWKPWLAFSNGPWPSGRIDWHPDLLDGHQRDKDLYRWEQSTGPARQLIESLAPPDGLVLDPFAGTASYGAAALDAGRRFLGVEADEGRYEACCQRLREVAP